MRGVEGVCLDLDDTLVVERATADAVLLETCRIARAEAGPDPAALRAHVYREALGRIR